MDEGQPDSSRSAPKLRTVAQLPGPRGLPLFGHLLHFDESRIHLQLEDWSAIYGPLYRLRFLRTDVLVVSDTALVAQAFRARPGTWRRFGTIEVVAREAGAHGLFSAEGVEWARQRPLVLRAFDPGQVRRFVPRLQIVTDRLRRRWQHAARNAEVLDVQAEVMRYAVDAVTGLAFGVDINTIEREHNELNARLEKVLPMINRRLHAVFPYWRYLRLPVDRAFDRELGIIHGMLRELVAAAKQQLARDPTLKNSPRNLLQALLVAEGDDSGGEKPTTSPTAALTEDEVIGNLFTVLLAGQDTTASTLAWTIYLLSEHPPVWRRLVAEADELVARTGVSDADPVSAYAQACAAEAMRLHPVAPLHYFEACREATLGDVLLPKGTYLFCLTRLGAVDPAKVPEAGKYLPERWLDVEAEGSLKRLAMPFGAGPRMCPGRGLAMLEMRMLLTMLARHFELAEVRTEHGRPPAEHMAFTVHPEPLRMRLVERRTACRRHCR